MTKVLRYSWKMFDIDVNHIIEFIKTYQRRSKLKVTAFYGIPRGGLVLGVKLSNMLHIPLYLTLEEAAKKHRNIIILDDVDDTGETLNMIPDVEKYKVITLFRKPHTKFKKGYYVRDCKDDVWIQYPWER